MVSNLDIAPTMLEMAGLQPPADMQGESLVPLLNEENPQNWRKSFYYHYYEFPGRNSVRRHYGIRSERYKLVHFYNIDEWELYDLEQDPDEVQNLYHDSDYTEVRAELTAELAQLRERYEVPNDTQPTEIGVVRKFLNRVWRFALRHYYSIRGQNY